jgi:ADP-ribose pyrophosphatase
MNANPAAACTMKDGPLVSTEVLLPRPKRFVRETLEMPDGYTLDWYFVDCPASVMVVPVTADGRVILVRQYRHNLRGYGLEAPAGNISYGEEPEIAARRELEEETQSPAQPRGAVSSMLMLSGSWKDKIAMP